MKSKIKLATIFFFSNKIVEDTKTSKALDNQRSLLKVVNGGYVLADHSFDHMSHNSEDSPRNAYTDVEQDMVSNFSWTEIRKKFRALKEKWLLRLSDL